MPYKNITELPPNLQILLPKHAQEIFMEAFNHAWEEYKDPGKRRGSASREETSRKVAWAAVKREYEKGEDEKWHRIQKVHG